MIVRGGCHRPPAGMHHGGVVGRIQQVAQMNPPGRNSAPPRGRAAGRGVADHLGSRGIGAFGADPASRRPVRRRSLDRRRRRRLLILRPIRVRVAWAGEGVSGVCEDCTDFPHTTRIPDALTITGRTAPLPAAWEADPGHDPRQRGGSPPRYPGVSPACAGRSPSTPGGTHPAASRR